MGLALEIIKKFKKTNLKVTYCRGQTYENATNMSGKYKVEKTRVLYFFIIEFGKLFTVHCA